YLSVTTTYYATLLLLAVVLTAQVAALVRYVQRTNRDLARFMLAIRHSDFSQSFAVDRSSTSFGELAAAFEEILQRFRAARTAKEEQASYLDTFVQHVPVAVMSIDESGRVDQFNHAARRLFGVGAPRLIHEFTSFGPDFPQRIVALEPGRAELIKVTRGGTPLQLNVLATELKIAGRTHKIVSLLDIHGELEAREVEAWQNLIRVLTHEIMNSATPISSLAATAAELLAEARKHPGETSAIDDAHDAVETIATRSSGLVHFVDNYRRLTRLPKPSPRCCAAAGLLDRAAQLMQPELAARGIALSRSVTPRNLEIDADPELLEQVLINLLRNAIDALGDTARPEIRLAAEIDNAGHAVIAVLDNGQGMDEQVRQNIFVPFFTTKRHGTGIGLSLVRQIMRAHRGSVGVESAPGEGTAVHLRFGVN
ncbi:MAG TPA: ATP-binding protein, partial [Gammaproteobacteria bacterium]|nr:ATP-binding protein [Gammaproteobacteria bacterium]